MPELRSRPALCPRVSNAATLPPLLPVLLPRIGLLPRRHDHQLWSDGHAGRPDLPVFSVVSRPYSMDDEHEDSALDGLCNRIVIAHDASFLQLLARTRFLDNAAATRTTDQLLLTQGR